MKSRQSPGADLTQDLRFAFRTLRRSPGFTAVAILTLALGIGGATSMFSVLNAAMGRALPYPEADRLVLGRATFSGNVNPWVAFPDYMDYRDQSATLESLAAFTGGSSLVTVTGADRPEQIRRLYVTPNLFSTLGVNPALGRTFTMDELPSDGAGQVVVSHDFWQSWFGGDPEVVGRTLIVGGGPYTVMGVMPPGFRFFDDADIWTPPWPGNSNPINRRYHNWLVLGRLSPEAKLSEARSEVEVISAQLRDAYPDSNETKALRLDGLQQALLEGYQQSLFLLVGAVVLVLLIACSNVASLLMARGSSRAGELAVRGALGAGRWRLTRQLLTECVVLAVSAGSLGLVLAAWLQDLILTFVQMDRLGLTDVGLSPAMLGIAVGLTAGTILLFGALPSLAAARTNPGQEMKEGARGSSSRAGIRFRNGLVILQVALSLLLLVSAGLLIRSFSNLMGVDPGYRVENLLTASIVLPSDTYEEESAQIRFFRELEESVQALPGVQSVGLVNRLPILQTAGNVAIWAPERPPETNVSTPWADRRVVLPGYFETMEIPLLEGRLIQEGDVDGSTPVVVLTRRTAELVFPGESAVDRQVAVDIGRDEPGYYQVVGVVEDHQLSSLSGAQRPAMFFSFSQEPTRAMRLAVATATPPESFTQLIQERLWMLDEDIVLGSPSTMEEAITNSVGGLRAVMGVLTAFSLVALTLAALGLYGVLAFLVARRQREIGIRIALGATGTHVLLLVVSRGMILVLAGTALGLGGALLGAGWIQDMLFQVNPRDWVTYGWVTAFFLLVALAASLLPARRALKVNPVDGFRQD